MASYERLSGLDETFLAFETPSAYMHVAATAIFDAAPLRTPTGGIDMARIRQHVLARLDRLPRFRQRLAFIPVTQDAVWVDDDAFDLAYHVRHASLPRPGSDQQLRERCAEILERPLNRARPLWEVWIIEGLADDAFALVAKVHHCIVDGIAGVGVLANLLSLDAAAAPEPARPWRAQPAPSPRDLLRDEGARRWRATVDAGRALGRAALSPGAEITRAAGAARGLWQLARTGFAAAPPSCFNRPIGPHRQVRWVALDLDRLRRIKTRVGGTLNDVVLTCVAGALGTVAARHGGLPAEGMLRAAVPVSVRTADDAAAPGNRVSIWFVPLPVDEPDPVRRLDVINAATMQLKRRNDAASASMLTTAADWTGAAVLSWTARLLNSARIYNLIVTNVPGPPVPLYLLGARMRAAYPDLPLFENQGLGVALLSYLDRLFVGLTGDWSLGVLVDEFVEALVAAADALGTAVGLDATDTPAAPVPRRIRSD